MEFVVGIGLCGAVALGTASVIKIFTTQQKKVGAGMSVLTIEKMLEQHLNSRKGCQSLIGGQIDTDVGFTVGSYDFSGGYEIGEYFIRSVKLVDFSPTDVTLKRGLTKVTVTMEKGEEKIVKVVPVSVNVTDEMRIESCFASEQLLEEEIINRVCSDTYGEVSQGLPCEEAARAMKNHLIEDICRDLNQGEDGSFAQGTCMLKTLHASQSCEEGKVASGFDFDGKILCNGARLSPPTNVCKKWGDWLPADTDICEGDDFEQMRTCEDGVLITKEKRNQTGALDCKVDCSIWYRGRVDTVESKANLDGSWSSYKSSDLGDCNNPPLCGIMMGLSCVGNIKVQLVYSHMSADQESFPVTSPWSDGEGSLVWGGWASTFTADTNECVGTKKCGLQVKANTNHPRFKCNVNYQYKNDKDISSEAMNGDWSFITNSDTKEANCDEGNGCGIRATIDCKKK